MTSIQCGKPTHLTATCSKRRFVAVFEWLDNVWQW